MTTTLNGRPPRKQLSDQLDRMDTLIDGLAEALPEAVADACREGARQAVKEAIAELLANTELRSQLAHMAPQPPLSAEPLASLPNRWQRLKAKLMALKTRCTQRLRSTTDHAKNRYQRCTNVLLSLWLFLASVHMVKRMAVLGSVLGIVAGVGSYLCPHSVAALTAGIGVGCTAVAVQVGVWLRRMAHGFGLSR